MKQLTDIIHELASIQGAIAGRADQVPLPEWWDGPAIDRPRRALQVAGSDQVDINSQEPVLDEARRPIERTPLRVAGAWRDDLEPEDNPPATWRSSGVETLAWYSSYHHCAYAWGIFIRSWGLERVAAALLRHPGVGPDEAYRMGWQFLYRHELVHFMTDILVTGSEFAGRTPIYLPGRQNQATRSSVPHAEEGLATAVARRALSHRAAGLDSWLDAAPAGYREWRKFTPSKRQTHWQHVLGDLAIGRPLPFYWTPETKGLPPYAEDVPVFLVFDSPAALPNIADAFIGPISYIRESDSFRQDMDALVRGQPRVYGLFVPAVGLTARAG